MSSTHAARFNAVAFKGDFEANVTKIAVWGYNGVELGIRIRAAGDRISHFHVADSNHWYPGAGHLDFKSIVDALFATGYQGFVSGEFMPMPDADTLAHRAITYLRGIQ